MENLIPRNTPEIPVSGRSGRIMMVKLGREGTETGFCGRIVVWSEAKAHRIALDEEQEGGIP